MLSQTKSSEYKTFLRQQKNRQIMVFFWQVIILVAFFGIWELSTRLGWLDSFIFSSPVRMYNTLITMIRNGLLFEHIWITSFEVMISFVLGTILGILIAVILWWSELLNRILNPYLVVFNALPKTALAPIIIVWFGNNIRSIIVVALLISVVVTILNVLSGFLQVEKEKIVLAKSFSANKLQLLTKVVFPASIGSICNALKVNVGLSFVGVIVGEFLVARAGLGFLIVQGSQIFRMDMVMLSILLLCLLAWLFYQIITFVERRLSRYL